MKFEFEIELTCLIGRKGDCALYEFSLKALTPIPYSAIHGAGGGGGGGAAEGALNSDGAGASTAAELGAPGAGGGFGAAVPGFGGIGTTPGFGGKGTPPAGFGGRGAPPAGFGGRGTPGTPGTAGPATPDCLRVCPRTTEEGRLEPTAFGDVAASFSSASLVSGCSEPSPMVWPRSPQKDLRRSLSRRIAAFWMDLTSVARLSRRRDGVQRFSTCSTGGGLRFGPSSRMKESLTRQSSSSCTWTKYSR